MKQLALLLPLALLAACGEEAAPEPAPTETATPEPVNTLAAPDKTTLQTAFDDSCEGMEPVNVASCKRAGFGSEDVICEFGLGKDEYLRNKATLSPNEDVTKWVLADPATVCAANDATPKAS